MVKPRKTLQNIKAYSIDKYYQQYNLKLDSNENLYGASPRVLDVMRNFPKEKISLYPAYGELLDLLAEFYGSCPDSFLLTNGCDEGINVLFNAFLDPDDEVLSYSPTFSMPKIYADVIGANFVEIPYQKRWEFDLKSYILNISNKTKILYLTSPNNPTGDMIKTADIRELLTLYKDKLVVLDCTYFNYSEISKSEYFDLVSEFDNLVILKSLSKDYALAGLRIGYIYANPEIISEIKKVISPYSVNSTALHCAIAALSDKDYFAGVKNNVLKSKRRLEEGFSKLGYAPENTSANFILCSFGKYADFIYNKFLSSGIKVKYFKGIEGLEDTFRITAPKLEDVDRVLEAAAPRPLFVFDMDGVIFDVKNSYRLAIKKTFEHFAKKECPDETIQNVKNMGGMSNDWDVTAYLLKNAGIEVEYSDLVNVFQNLFFISGRGGLIDREEIILDKNFFSEITKFADCAIFTGRPKEEAFYSLEKYDIKKYFSYFVCNEDVEGNYKPSPFGLNLIKSNCKYSEIFYFGDTVDDIKAGLDAFVNVYGIIPPNCSLLEKTVSKLLECGAAGVIENINSDKILNLVKKDKICSK